MSILVIDAQGGGIGKQLAKAKRILIPFTDCNTYIAGLSNLSTSKLIANAIDELRKTVI